MQIVNPMKNETDTISCPHCIERNSPQSIYCVKCGGPLLPIATIGPFEIIETQGFALREATNRPKKLIVVIGTWILYFPFVIVTLIPAIAEPVLLFVYLPLVLIPGVLVYKTTRNYIRYKQGIAQTMRSIDADAVHMPADAMWDQVEELESNNNNSSRTNGCSRGVS